MLMLLLDNLRGPEPNPRPSPRIVFHLLMEWIKKWLINSPSLLQRTDGGLRALRVRKSLATLLSGFSLMPNVLSTSISSIELLKRRSLHPKLEHRKGVIPPIQAALVGNQVEGMSRSIRHQHQGCTAVVVIIRDHLFHHVKRCKERGWGVEGVGLQTQFKLEA